MTKTTCPRFPVSFARRGAVIAGICLWAAGAAPAFAMEDIFSAQQEAVEKPGGGMKVVTPLKDCLDKLPPEEAAAVQRNFMKPYQECHLRLQAFLQRGGSLNNTENTATAEGEAKTKTVTAGEKEPPPAENPRNFIRVRKDDGPRRPAAHYGDVQDKEEAPPRPAWDSGYNR